MNSDLANPNYQTLYRKYKQRYLTLLAGAKYGSNQRSQKRERKKNRSSPSGKFSSKHIREQERLRQLRAKQPNDTPEDGSAGNQGKGRKGKR